jgi:hypothetical protein
MILAHRRARKAVEVELRSKCIRTTLIRPAEINALAREFYGQLKPALGPSPVKIAIGRKRKLTAHQQQEALARRAWGEALVDIARSYAGSHSTISRLA